MQTGKVQLDLSWYSGQDLYSDGEIEEELLEIAQNIPPSDYNAVIARKKSWPVFYHFSHLRENILTWIPFTGSEKVLEIGSGCGAVTGALCRKAREVTGIDLSLKRSRINAFRNRDAENLRLLVGNFEDIEPDLPSDYDVITLIGVFEYGAGYIHDSEPYEEFLRRIGRHLKPGGKISIVAQTTFHYNIFQDFVEKIKEMDYDVFCVNTICNATQERQAEAERIASQVDAMIVIGGKSSSNTRKLYDICRQECKSTYYIQTLKDLEPDKTITVRNVGITAGASTPNYIIEEVSTNVRRKF